LIRQIASKVEKLELSRQRRETTADFAMGFAVDLEKYEATKKTYFLVIPNDSQRL